MLKKFHLQKGLIPKFSYILLASLLLIIGGLVVLFFIFPSPRSSSTITLLIVYSIIAIIVWTVALMISTIKYFTKLHKEIVIDITTNRATNLGTFKRLSGFFDDLPNNGKGWVVAFLCINNYDNFLNVFGYSVSNNVLWHMGEIFTKFVGKNGVASYLYNGRFLLLFENRGTNEETLKAVLEAQDRISNISIEDSTVKFDHKCLTSSSLFFCDGKPCDIDYCTSILKTNLNTANYPTCVDLTKRINHQSELLHSLSGDVETAFKNGDFKACCQPRFSIDERRIVGVELYARWEHPEKGLLTPGDFITLLENTGKIFDLDVLMMHYACDIIKDLIAKKIPPVPVTVNISTRTILREQCVMQLLQIAHDHNVPTNLIELSLPQSVVAENVTLLSNVSERLSLEGFTLSLEHFTLETSTLTLLAELNITVVNLHKSFYRNLNSSDRAKNLLYRTIELLKSLGIQVIGENVENEDDLALLMQCGCTYAQGYFLAKPATYEEFVEKLLNE